MKHTLIASLFLCLLVVLQGCDAQGQSDVEPPARNADQLDLVFGVYTSDRPTDVVRQFRPLLDALEGKLNESLDRDVVIKMKVAENYDLGIEDLVNGRVDFSRFGPASFVLATEKNPGITLLAKETVKGEEVFYGIICAHTDGSIKTVADLDGGSFAFGSEQSTIGRYLSQLHLSQNGINADDLDRYEYLGRHDTVGMAVSQGRFDAGALKESTFKKLADSGEPIIEIARFENVTKPWAGRAGLDSEVHAALSKGLLELVDPAALEAIGKSGFVAGDITDYDVTREAIVNNDAFFKKEQ